MIKTAKYTKKQLLVAIAFGLAVFFQVAEVVFLRIQYPPSFFNINWPIFALSLVRNLFLILFCILPYAREHKKVFLTIVGSVGAAAALASRSSFSYGTLFSLATYVLFILVIHKPGKALAVATTIVWGVVGLSCLVSAFTLIRTALVSYPLLYNFTPYYLCFSAASSLAFAVGILCFWFFEFGHLLAKKKPEAVPVAETLSSFEDALLSLKNQFDNGEISLEEYLAKKAEILKNL